jgi:hypothetical protein
MASGGGGEPEHLPAAELLAVGALWKQAGRELVVSFGGTSMLPTIPPGAEVLLRCGEDAAPGEVIAFIDGGQVVVHRILARSAEAGWILTCGDASSIPDPPFRDLGRIVGRVLLVRRGDEMVALPGPPPGSLRQRALRGLCLFTLRRSDSAGRALIVALRRLRRALLLKRL